ncbi:hypothetical protein H0H92_004315 [Tricholoma furcatifolium]|nr:hypothetical protein H0H92_004315 [Tricholoma furcatifolium]
MFEPKHAILPLYSPSEPSPNYSCEPACDERTLQHTPRQMRSTPTGVFIRRSGKTTVTLYDQEDGAATPVYGRYGEISGSLLIEDPQKVTQVTIKIEGTLNTTIAESGSKSIPLLNMSEKLWSKVEGDQLSGYLAFSYLLPPTFMYEGASRPLPPSYEDNRSSVATFYLRSMYWITVCVTRMRHSMDFLTKADEFKIPFRYYPRTRAHRPIVPSPGFFSSVKTSPEEWYQTVAAMRMRKEMPELGVINCHLFVPAARVYGIGDKIPFHVQLNGPIVALQKLLMPQPANAPPPTPWSSKKHGKCPDHTKPKIRVYLLRQSHIETRGYKSWRNTPMGEGEVWELPPCIAQGRDAMHLDWAGEVQLNADTTVGGFVAGNVAVKDFIVLALDPPTVDNHPSPFLAAQITVPIRFVTESYMEVTDYDQT